MDSWWDIAFPIICALKCGSQCQNRSPNEDRRERKKYLVRIIFTQKGCGVLVNEYIQYIFNIKGINDIENGVENGSMATLLDAGEGT